MNTPTPIVAALPTLPRARLSTPTGPLPARVTAETPEEAAERRAASDRARLARYEAGRKTRYAAASYDTLTEHQHRAAVAGWLDSGALNLLMGGNTGAGKNFAAFAVGNDAIVRGLSVAAYEWTQLVAALRPDERHPERASLTEGIVCTVDLLIVNDLGREKTTDWVQEKLHTILVEREAELRSIVTTNLGPAEVADRYGSQILDRLEERSLRLWFSGPSMRQADGWATS